MTSQPLPEHLRPLFWDYDFGRLDWTGDQNLIIARILQEGGDQAAAWLQQQVGPVDLARWIREHRGRGLDPRRLRFWQLILDLPETEVRAWIQETKSSPGKVQ